MPLERRASEDAVELAFSGGFGLPKDLQNAAPDDRRELLAP